MSEYDPLDDAKGVLFLVDELRKRELVAACIKCGTVEVRLGQVIDSKPMDEPDLQEYARREDARTQELMYGAGAGGFVPGAFGVGDG